MKHPDRFGATRHLGRRTYCSHVSALDEQQARDLLFGDTDPRELALFLAQQGLTMEAQERDQRMTILNALNIQSNRALAIQTGELARHTRSVATWTRAMAIATFVLALVSIGIAVFD